MSTAIQMPAKLRVNKSTNVRSKDNWISSLFRQGMRRFGDLLPGLGAALAQRVFFTPPRAPLREAEREVLEGGRQFHIEVRGRPLVGWRWGEGPVALLVHGWGGHAGQMTELVAPLVAAGFEAVAIDLPGHGISAGKRSSIVHFAQAVEAAAAHLGEVDAVIAHSLGAAGVTLALSRGLRTRRVAYFAPPARFERIWARFREGLGISMPVWQRMMRRSELWLGLSFNGIEPALLAPQLSVPLLVLHDVGDREVPFEEGEQLAGLWRGAELRRSEGLGHLRILKDRVSVWQAVAFVSSRTQRGTRRSIAAGNPV